MFSNAHLPKSTGKRIGQSEKIAPMIVCLVLAFIAIFSPAYSGEKKTVTVSSFGAEPDDEQNDAPALRKAIDYCRTHPGTTLYFKPGRYDFRDEKAVQFMQDVMGGKFGKDPEKIVFKPGFNYVKGLDLAGTRDLTLVANGVELIIDGWMEAVSVEKCSNVTIKGLTIDYKRSPHSEGKVVNTGDGYFDVEFEKEYPVTNDMVMPRIMFWDTNKNRLLPQTLYFPKKNELIAPNTLRIWANYSPEVLHSIALVNHTFHFRPAILIHEATNTRLENVTIYAQPGMGVVGHRAHNVTMNGLRVVPRPGRKMSTNTDATHFTSCTGTIRFDGCQFEGQGDDATNVHNYYYSIMKTKNARTPITSVLAPTGTHIQVLDYPDAGNRLELVEKKTLAAVKTYVVKSVKNDPANWTSELILNDTLPSHPENYYLINVTRLPRLEFVNSSVMSHLARGILIKTRSVLVENCLFRETTGTAIHIGAEGGWHEGATAADVIIRNNRILRCGRGAGTQGKACAIAVLVGAPKKDVPGLHKRLLFENNLIEGENAGNGIFVSGADDVEIRYNSFSGCQTPVKIQHSTHVKVHHNYPSSAGGGRQSD